METLRHGLTILIHYYQSILPGRGITTESQLEAFDQITRVTRSASFAASRTRRSSINDAYQVFNRKESIPESDGDESLSSRRR